MELRHVHNSGTKWSMSFACLAARKLPRQVVRLHQPLRFQSGTCRSNTLAYSTETCGTPAMTVSSTRPNMQICCAHTKPAGSPRASSQPMTQSAVERDVLTPRPLGVPAGGPRETHQRAQLQSRIRLPAACRPKRPWGRCAGRAQPPRQLECLPRLQFFGKCFT